MIFIDLFRTSSVLYCIGRTNSIFTSPQHAGRISAPPNHLRIGFSHRTLKNQRYLSTHIHRAYLPLISMWNARTCLYSWPWREPKSPRQHIFLLCVFPSQEMQGSQSCPTAKQGWDPHPRMAWRYLDAEEVVRDPTASAALRRRHADGRLEQCYRVTEGG